MMAAPTSAASGLISLATAKTSGVNPVGLLV